MNSRKGNMKSTTGSREWAKELLEKIDRVRAAAKKDPRSTAAYWNCDGWGSIQGYREAEEWVNNQVIDSIVKLTKDLQEENTKLLNQLPEDMKSCTIRCKECKVGHAWLTATNWVQHGCPTCERDKLRDAIRKLLQCDPAPIEETAWHKARRVALEALQCG